MSKANKIAAASLVIMGLMVVIVLLVVSNSQTSTVRAYFDNGLDNAVKIELDGKEALSLPAHSAALYESLAVGKHKVRVLDDKGKTVEENELDVPAARGIELHSWAYNVGKKCTYEVSFVAYGNATPDKPRPIGEGQFFFELPSTSARFLPAEIPSDKGRAGTTVAVVGHKPGHKDWPCCANLRALTQAPPKKN